MSQKIKCAAMINIATRICVLAAPIACPLHVLATWRDAHGEPIDEKGIVATKRSEVPEKVIANSIGMKLALIPAGEFMMGTRESDADLLKLFARYNARINAVFQDERPVHQVRIIKPFYLGVHHVTVGEFRQFANATGWFTDAEKRNASKERTKRLSTATGRWEDGPYYTWQEPGFKQTRQHPVVCVNWSDVVAFCKWLGRRERKTYRVPTEAEWEYACRAGTTTLYWFGNDPEDLAKAANVADAALSVKFRRRAYYAIRASDGYVFTSPVGTFRANPFGIYDMGGNAFQWCSDRYDDNYYATSPRDDPPGPQARALAPGRVLRGGSFLISPWGARSAARAGVRIEMSGNDIGFRVVREL
jgi:formylglycine-generating enzyme required for sulfatase activity